MRRTLDLIEAGLDGDLPLAVLAAEVGLSVPHFTRAFRASLGVPPHRYLLKRRLERAREMLLGGGLGLADIAAAAGFSSQAHMTAAFRKEFGITPGQFRTQAGSGALRLAA
jgi:AraC family transcriptional regulator